MALEYEGTIGELDSAYSVNKHNPDTLEIEDSMTEGQRQWPKRMKSGGKKCGREWGSLDF
jgi:hypothetical protein